MLISGPNIGSVFAPCDLEVSWMTLNTTRQLFYFMPIFVHHFKALLEIKLELLSGNAQFCPNRLLFLPTWPSNLQMTFKNTVHSNWGYRLKTIKLVFDPCELDLWPLALTFVMDITFIIYKNSRKCHDHTMMGTELKGVTGGQADWRTDWTILRATWSQLKNTRRGILCNRNLSRSYKSLIP